MTGPPADQSRVAARWTPALMKRWVPVSSYFLANYHRLPLHRQPTGLTSSEALLLLHLLDYKWDEKAPWPSLAVLARRMGVTRRAARMTLAKLEEKGLLRRAMPAGAIRTSRYHIEGLFEQLEALQAEDEAKEKVARVTARGTR